MQAKCDDTKCGHPMYPKEIRDISWLNTSEEIMKKGYKIFAHTYDEWANGSEQDPRPGYVGHFSCAGAFNTAVSDVYGDIDKKNLKLLDLGCGTGLLGKILKEKHGFDNLVGIDVSEEMLERAKEKKIYRKLICSYVSTERAADVEDAEYDGVVASGMIVAGLINPPVFDEILRWIKPGGIICFNCRSDSYETAEYGYKEKFESLEKQKRWELISNSVSDYYGVTPTPEHRGIRARVLVYRILPF